MQLQSFGTEEAPGPLLTDIRTLMDAAFDSDFDDTDWAHALGGIHVVALDAGRLVAHGSVVERNLEVDGRSIPTGYVEAVATRPDKQGLGFGTAVMSEIGVIIRVRYHMGALATGAYRFYERLGWRRWAGPTAVARHGTIVRTPDDDDAIMVLLHGPTEGVDLTESLVCDDRPGDVW